MMYKILKLDFNDVKNTWVLQIERRDGRRGEVRFSPDAFKIVRGNAMGQFLLWSWFGRAQYQAEEQPST